MTIPTKPKIYPVSTAVYPNFLSEKRAKVASMIEKQAVTTNEIRIRRASRLFENTARIFSIFNALPRGRLSGLRDSGSRKMATRKLVPQIAEASRGAVLGPKVL